MQRSPEQSNIPTADYNDGDTLDLSTTTNLEGREAFPIDIGLQCQTENNKILNEKNIIINK